MKAIQTLSLFLGVVSASPTGTKDLIKRQGIISDELKSGPCRAITFVWARASTEPYNMGISMGPMVCSGLKQRFGRNNVACQGVGGPYIAGLVENILPPGTTNAAIEEAIKMYELAATKCPQTKIVGGGYSQGSAVTSNAINRIPQDLKDKVLGVLLYGYTKNAQTRSSIPGYPDDRVKIFCRMDDGVCLGTLLVTVGHFGYLLDGSGPQGINFLAQKIQAA